ncbi:hypothetical protein HY251_06135 [bacterium]|nr:hypothetical protein [bacterium]
MSEPRARSSHFALSGILLAAVFLGAYFLAATTVGFHGPEAPWEAYGETPVPGPVRQPLCFWTDLAFVIAGVAALRRLDRASRAGEPPANPMSAPSSFSVALGLIVVWMGPASMLEHGTLTETWGWFDASSIHWFSLFIAGYLLLRAIPGAASSRSGRATFWASEATAWLVLGAWTWRDASVRIEVSKATLALMGSATVASLLLGRFVGLRFARGAWRWFLALALAFAAGVGFLIAGARGGALAPWGHGAWHLCCGAATFFVAGFLGSEAPRTSAKSSSEGSVPVSFSQ